MIWIDSWEWFKSRHFIEDYKNTDDISANTKLIIPFQEMDEFNNIHVINTDLVYLLPFVPLP